MPRARKLEVKRNLLMIMTIIRLSIVMNMTDMKSMASMMIVACLIKCLVVLFIVIMKQFSKINPTYRSSVGSSGSLNFMTWNASGIMSSGSYPGHILGTYDVDFCGVSEHWLYKKDHHFFDSIDKSYNYFVESDFDLEVPSRRKVGWCRLILEA